MLTMFLILHFTNTVDRGAESEAWRGSEGGAGACGGRPFDRPLSRPLSPGTAAALDSTSAQLPAQRGNDPNGRAAT